MDALPTRRSNPMVPCLNSKAASSIPSAPKPAPAGSLHPNCSPPWCPTPSSASGPITAASFRTNPSRSIPSSSSNAPTPFSTPETRSFCPAWPSRRRPSNSRASSASSSAKRAKTSPNPRPDPCLRLHHCQRCLRLRLAAGPRRQPMVQRQGLRHLLPPRSHPRHRR